MEVRIQTAPGGGTVNTLIRHTPERAYSLVGHTFSILPSWYAGELAPKGILPQTSYSIHLWGKGHTFLAILGESEYINGQIEAKLRLNCTTNVMRETLTLFYQAFYGNSSLIHDPCHQEDPILNAKKQVSMALDNLESTGVLQ